MKLAEKHETGQEGIKIVKFEKRNSYYLYIYDPETRKVSTPSLNSEDLGWCQRNWFQTYASFQKKGGSPKQRKKVAITTKLKAYVEHQWQRTKRGEIKESTYKTYNERITNRIAPFIKAKESSLLAISIVSPSKTMLRITPTKESPPAHLTATSPPSKTS